jgi:hypothetical protein
MLPTYVQICALIEELGIAQHLKRVTPVIGIPRGGRNRVHERWLTASKFRLAHRILEKQSQPGEVQHPCDRDDRGHTFVERGIDKLRVGAVARQWIKFLALFAYVHVSMFLVFTVPMQWFATHSDAFPAGYPSYMINGLCAYGPNQDQCPGPGVMMPRPLENPL